MTLVLFTNTETEAERLISWLLIADPEFGFIKYPCSRPLNSQVFIIVLLLQIERLRASQVHQH